MKGFLLTGAGGGTYGLIIGYGESRIHGGVINRFRYSGIYLRNNAWLIEDVQIVRNGGMGVDATGARFITVKNSLIAANNGFGVTAGDSATLRDSSISSNGSQGTNCSVNCRIEGNSIENNLGFGAVLTSGIVIGNLISGHAGEGIVDTGRADVGLANNILIDNAPTKVSQQVGGVRLHPHACIGTKPCDAP